LWDILVRSSRGLCGGGSGSDSGSGSGSGSGSDSGGCHAPQTRKSHACVNASFLHFRGNKFQKGWNSCEQDAQLSRRQVL
jgi:hypothetical protein